MREWFDTCGLRWGGGIYVGVAQYIRYKRILMHVFPFVPQPCGPDASAQLQTVDGVASSRFRQPACYRQSSQSETLTWHFKTLDI